MAAPTLLWDALHWWMKALSKAEAKKQTMLLIYQIIYETSAQPSISSVSLARNTESTGLSISSEATLCCLRLGYSAIAAKLQCPICRAD